jgi:hypothetical protein
MTAIYFSLIYRIRLFPWSAAASSVATGSFAWLPSVAITATTSSVVTTTTVVTALALIFRE